MQRTLAWTSRSRGASEPAVTALWHCTSHSCRLHTDSLYPKSSPRAKTKAQSCQILATCIGQHAMCVQRRAGSGVLEKYGHGEQADLDEGGALRGLGAVVHDGAPLHGHQPLNATIRRHAPAPPPLHNTQPHYSQNKQRKCYAFWQA